MTIAAPAIDFEITDQELGVISSEYENKPPEAVLRWALAEFGPDVALATGFGAEGCVLIDMVAHFTNGTRIFYLDTDLLFSETYALCSRLEARYGIRLERRSSRLSLELQARQFGDRLWERQPDLCCRLRKVEPLQEVLIGLRAWITAIRRDQTAARAGAGIVERLEVRPDQDQSTGNLVLGRSLGLHRYPRCTPQPSLPIWLHLNRLRSLYYTGANRGRPTGRALARLG